MIDFHTHIFPDEISEKAIDILAKTGGNMFNYSKGRLDETVKILEDEGVSKAVVLNIATNVKQTKKVNDFAIKINGYKDKLISFGSVHPDDEGAIEELRRLKDNGIKGVKLHPQYQEFYVDDPRMKEIYEEINKLGLTLLFHAGRDLGFYDQGQASPERFKNIIKYFDKPIVIAHMGGYMDWYDVEKHLVSQNVYFDTSFSFSRIPLPLMNNIVKKHGADKILFGSDIPWSLPSLEKRLIDALSIDDCEKEKIFFGNAQKLLGI